MIHNLINILSSVSLVRLSQAKSCHAINTARRDPANSGDVLSFFSTRLTKHPNGSRSSPFVCFSYPSAVWSGQIWLDRDFRGDDGRRRMNAKMEWKSIVWLTINLSIKECARRWHRNNGSGTTQRPNEKKKNEKRNPFDWYTVIAECNERPDWPEAHRQKCIAFRFLFGKINSNQFDPSQCTLIPEAIGVELRNLRASVSWNRKRLFVGTDWLFCRLVVVVIAVVGRVCISRRKKTKWIDNEKSNTMRGKETHWLTADEFELK